MQEILVDEYQDINPIQQRLLEIVHGGRGQVMVVGDPDQTIYEFRGSQPTLLTEGFTDSFEQVQDYELSWTFRYGHHLSLLANHLIGAHHPRPDSRTLCYSHPVTPPTRVEQVRSDDGASTALGLIQQIRQQRPLSEIAVLNRLWANSARLELLLMAADVPYHLDHHQTVLERFELRPFWVLFDLASGDFSRYDPDTRRQAWQTLLTQPYLKIRKAVIDDLVKQLAPAATDVARQLRNAIPESLSGYQADQLMERARLLQKAEQAKAGASELLSGWIRGTEYYAALKESAFSAQQVDDQVATVKAFAQFVAAQDWASADASPRLRQWQQRKTDATATNQQQGVHITSIHKAKGREWPIVILPEVNARFYPYHPEGDLTRPTSEDSERRLLYVAMTRAREHLVLLTPADRSENPDSPFVNDLRWLGSTDLAHALTDRSDELTLSDNMDTHMVSRYLNAVESPLNVYWQAAPRPSDAVTEAANEDGHASDARRVRHQQWGVGRIVQQDPQRLRIRFVRNGQEKTFDRETVAPFLEWL
jgi:DNA helicase-2/ATP-dependent DNA helicase PcrA